MDLSVSPMIADVVMQDLEKEFLKIYISIIFYWRYVEYSFIIISKNNLLLKFINNYHHILNFTHEIGNNYHLNFLDTLVIKNQDNTVSIDLYEKSIASDR